MLRMRNSWMGTKAGQYQDQRPVLLYIQGQSHVLARLLDIGVVVLIRGLRYAIGVNIIHLLGQGTTMVIEVGAIGVTIGGVVVSILGICIDVEGTEIIVTAVPYGVGVGGGGGLEPNQDLL